MRNIRKWKTRIVRVGVLSVIASAILGYAEWQRRNSWKLVAVDDSGKPVAGVEVYVTYPSDANLPRFVTESEGIASIKPRSKEGIASLSLYFQGKKLGIPWRNVRWPVRVVVSPEGIEVSK
jgi:hypothetical protein